MADIKVRVGQSDAIKVLSTSMVSAGIVTTTQHAEVADYAKIAGIATYASTAGVSTSVSGGTASVTQLNVVGVTTIGGTLNAGLIDGGSF